MTDLTKKILATFAVTGFIALFASYSTPSANAQSAFADALRPIGWEKFCKHAKLLVGRSKAEVVELLGQPSDVCSVLPFDRPANSDETIYYCLDKTNVKEVNDSEIRYTVLALSIGYSKVHSYTVVSYGSVEVGDRASARKNENKLE